MRRFILLLVSCFLWLLSPSTASAQQACPPAGAQFDHHDKYEGTVYSYDNGFVRLTSMGGTVSYSKRCSYKDAQGKIWQIGIDEPLKPVAANAPLRPGKPDPAAQSYGAILRGVYECDMGQMIGGMVMPVPQTGPMFGIFGPGSYRDFDGGRGSFSVAGNILTMTSGPLKGMRYRREGVKLFYPLDARGQKGPIRCVHNSAKSLSGRW